MKTLIALLLFAALALVASAEVITWDANPANEFVTSYNVYWSPSLTAPKPWPLLISLTGTSATNTTAGKFAYYVTAVNPSGESLPSDVAVQRPGNPQNPKVGK